MGEFRDVRSSTLIGAHLILTIISYLSPVCLGNRDYKIPTYSVYKNKDDTNARNFAHMICNELGYGKKARFLGNQDEYFQFLDRHIKQGRKPKGLEEEFYLKVIVRFLNTEYFSPGCLVQEQISGGESTAIYL